MAIITGTSSTEPLLSGVRVLDFGRYVAGPYCASLLADLGAEVIRVERLSGGEDRYVCPVAETGEGSLFLQLNRNKKSMTLNPLKSSAKEVLSRLVATADLVVANLPLDGLKQMGIDYESLINIKPDIILSSQSAFGDDGPYAGRTGFDGVAQAMSGATFMSGQPGLPTKSYASWCDFSTAMVAAYGSIAALFHKFKTGKGQHVSSNLLSTALNVFHFNSLEEYLTGRDRQASANRSQFGGPADLFQTRDGWIQVQVIGQPLFERWCNLIGEKHWLDDARFKTDNDRGINGAALSSRMQQWVGQYTTSEALVKLEEARIPAGPLLKPRETIDDEHVRKTGMMEWVNYPNVDQSIPLVGCPVKFSEFETSVRLRPPVLGEHTEQILYELGYDSAQVSKLRKERVI